MIVPDPSFAPVIVNYSDLSLFSRLKLAWRRSKFVLTDSWIITLDNGTRVLFPVGFVSDFASIPRLLWLIPGFTPTGPLLYGSIPHDFGFQYGYLLEVTDEGPVPIFIGAPQAFFDELLEDITVAKTGAVFVAKTARKVLSVFGKIPWAKYRKHGPSAYGENSLDLPWVNKYGILVYEKG